MAYTNIVRWILSARERNGWEVLVGSGWETSYLDVGIVLETCL